ncbi:hypothetical protein GGR56DRAFT_651650, partial [Xylariaceae sp. FL0804]
MTVLYQRLSGPTAAPSSSSCEATLGGEKQAPYTGLRPTLRGDRLWLIDAPADLIFDVRAVLGQGAWIRKDKGYTAPDVYEIKMMGRPWAASGKESMRVRKLVLDLLVTLKSYGWSVYAGVNQTNQGEDV